ncbi:phage holin family protein, partial [Pseudomonas sp. MD330_11]
GGLTAWAGADVAIGFYERWGAKRIGVNQTPTSRPDQL